MAEHIKGDTWSYIGTVGLKDPAGAPISLVGWTIHSYLYKKLVTEPIQVFTTTWTDVTQGTFMQRALNTSTWPTGQAYLVVRLTSPENEVISANSVIVNVKEI